jgi:hypothetical protein
VCFAQTKAHLLGFPLLFVGISLLFCRQPIRSLLLLLFCLPLWLLLLLLCI